MAAPTQKSKNLNRSNTYGTYPMTADKQWINASENYYLFQDAAATNTSPLPAVLNTGDTILLVPNGATKLRIMSSAALRIGDAAAEVAGYFVIPAATVMDWPISTPTNDPNSGNTGSIYLRGDSASCVVSFAFLCI